MTMKIALPIILLMLITTAGFVQADTLEILFSSGKSQTVELKEPGSTISSLKYGETASSSQKSLKEIKSSEGLNPLLAQPPSKLEKVHESGKKTGVRVNMHAKPMFD